MSDALTETALRGTLADLTTGPELPKPVKGVELRLLYDPFQPETVEFHDLGWRRGIKLYEYLKDMPEHDNWLFFHNAEEVTLEESKKIKVKKGDKIGVIQVPMATAGIKAILAAVGKFLTSSFIGQMLAGALMSIGIGLVMNLLFKPKTPKDNSVDEGTAYGIDGPKNSATEGIPYPAVYGEHWIGGNLADTYTENVGDDQYLYMRSILNDGEIEDVLAIEVNEQPLSSFSNVEYQVFKGTLDQVANGWFSRAISQRNKNMKLTTAWTSHVTTEPVDFVRFDVTFPQGLCEIDQESGDHLNRSITLETRYRALDPVTKAPIGDWNSLPNNGQSSHVGQPTVGPVAITDTTSVRVTAAVPLSVAQDPAATPRVRYRNASGFAQLVWINLDRIPANVESGGYIYEGTDGTITGSGSQVPMVSYTYTVSGLNADLPYEFEAQNGATIIAIDSTNVSTVGGNTVTYTDSRTRQIRKSIESNKMPRGFYEVAIRRVAEPEVSDYKFDEVWLADIAEILAEKSNLRGTANLCLKIKLNEQLNSIPTVTCKVKGSIVQFYDIEGNPTTRAWTNNPAWIALDVMLSQERGAMMALQRIDWPAFHALADYCNVNGITFNGVFDTETNVGEALARVLRIGHSVPIPFGTKVSVATDKPRDPVCVITSASIIEDTFQVNYLPMSDRANEYEVSYYDKNDRNKEKTIRYVDQKAVTFNELPRKVNIPLAGVDNIEQARTELWRALYSNRLIIRSVTLEMFMEAISLNIGDVALIQHQMMEWAQDGRLKAGSTASVINLDKKVEMLPDADYSVLVHFDALPITTASVSSLVGKTVLVPTSSASDNPSQLHRMTWGTNREHDYQITRVVKGAQWDSYTLSEASQGLSVGQTVTIYQTDVVVERDVVSTAQSSDDTTLVTLASPLPAAPGRYATFVFGEKVMVRKPYVLNGITGTGLEKRRLSFIEYHEGVYGEAEVEIPIPIGPGNDRAPRHVAGLVFDYEPVIRADRTVVNARVHWNPGNILNYGGADVYMALNGSPFRHLGNAVSGNEWTVQLVPGDRVIFKVVGYNKNGERAPLDSAPLIEGVIEIGYLPLAAPTGFTATSVAFQVDGTVKFQWTNPVNTSGVDSYEIQFKKDVSSVWTNGGLHGSGPVEISGLTTGTYDARIRSFNPRQQSAWVEADFVVVVTPGSLMANYLGSNDRNADAIAAPTLPGTGAVEHTLNSDSSANISLEWLWTGDEAVIDGFVVKTTQA